VPWPGVCSSSSQRLQPLCVPLASRGVEGGGADPHPLVYCCLPRKLESVLLERQTALLGLMRRAREQESSIDGAECE
jgi:hypothetical protein